MKKMKLLPIVLIMLFISFGASAGEVVLQDNFENQDALSHYKIDKWERTPGEARVEIVKDPEWGGTLYISSEDGTDIYVRQAVLVKPDTLYRVSARCMARLKAAEGGSATIWMDGTFAHAENLYDTKDQWVTLNLYCRTGPEQSEASPGLRLGGFSCTNAGWARFDDFEMAEVNEVPAGVTVLNIFTEDENEKDSEPDQSNQTQNGNTPDNSGKGKLRFLFMYLFIFAAYTWLVYFVIHKVIGKDGLKQPAVQASFRKKLRCFLPVFIPAALLQFALGYRLDALMCDMQWWNKWSAYIYEHGFLRFYQTIEFCDYPPLYIWMLWPIGALRANIPNIGWNLNALVVRLIPILCNLGCLILFYQQACQRFRVRTAVGLAAIAALEPSLILDSTGFGQTDSALTMLILLCALSAENKRFFRALIWFGLAVLLKPQALLFGPVGLAYMAIVIFRDIRENKDQTTLRHALAGIGVLAVLFYAAGFICSYEPGQSIAECMIKPWTWLVGKYGGTMLSYHYQTYNAANLYWLMGMNCLDVSVKPGVLIASYIAMAVIYLFAFFLLFRSRGKGALLLTGGIMMTMLFVAAPLMHERYGIPALSLLLVSACFFADLRLVIAAVVFSFVLFMNLNLVLHPSASWLGYVLAAICCLNSLFISWLGIDILIRKKSGR